jgi:hypothetical protein
MTKKRTAQSRTSGKTTTPDPAMHFAEMFMTQWQTQWQDMVKAGGCGMPPGMNMGMNMDGLNAQNGFTPLHQMGPMGLMAPMGAVALANLKLLQELQDRVKMLEAQLAKTPAPKSVKKPTAKKPKKK